MPDLRRRSLLAALATAGAGAAMGTSLLQSTDAAEPVVEVLRTPNGGIQPQAVIDGRGTIHLIYFTGTPKAGDLHYVRREPGATSWSRPLTVNTRPASAIATGTIRGGQLCLGKGGRVHVVWFGSGEAGVKGPGGSAPLLYSRLNDAGTAFEPQRNLMTRTTHLDGGPSVAADAAGGVTVAWHANDLASEGETRRGLFLARSTDEGRTFSAEVAAWTEPTGACACCNTKVLSDSKRDVWVLYRSAIQGTERDTYLLHGRSTGALAGGMVDPWKLNACPMASYTLTEGPGGVYGAWETAGQVLFGRATAQGRMTGVTGAPGTPGTRKHPSIAVNQKGEVLLAWAEGTGWQRGGDLAYQRFTADGKPLGKLGRAPGGIPVWGLPTVVARPDGGFTLIH